MLQHISELESVVIKFENRFDGWDGKTKALMTVDGTDCIVNEPWPFDKKWFSKKFNGPGVKYDECFIHRLDSFRGIKCAAIRSERFRVRERFGAIAVFEV